MDSEQEVANVVLKLLPSPLTTRQIEANDRDLPTYAEAAPETFLSIVERDLRTKNPAVMGLLRPVDPGAFGSHPSRTGLLWALENLSWNPTTLPRAAKILAALAEVEINDNWVNKPINSLLAIFKAWMPQTAATLEQRIELIRILAMKNPDVAWQICINQFGMHHQVGHYSHKPRWRSDGYGHGEPLSRQPIIDFIQAMIDIVLSWPSYSVRQLCDLIERLFDLDEPSRAKVWERIGDWAKQATDSDKATLREKIRVTIFSRRGVQRTVGDAGIVLTKQAKSVYELLEPQDLLKKHAWLFKDAWVEESADELGDDDLDYEKREESIKQKRVAAIKDILLAHGLQGVLELAEEGNAAWQIGALLAIEVLVEKQIPETLVTAFASARTTESWSIRNLISGVLQAIGDESNRQNIIRSIARHINSDQLSRLLLLAPFRPSTWKLVDELVESDQKDYWREVRPNWAANDSSADIAEAVNRLLAAQRPKAAFPCLHYRYKKVDASLICQVLHDIAMGNDEPENQYRLEQYEVEQAFIALNKNSNLTLDQKAGLEFAYIDGLAQRWSTRENYGIPNLELYVEAHPDFYVQAIVWTYKRNDGGSDPPDMKTAPDHVQRVATRAYKLLDGLHKIPGTAETGAIDIAKLATWISTVRNACTNLGRREIADTTIGRLLANAPIGADGVWPCEPVRQIIEELQSEDISKGAQMGVYNSRGVHTRVEGGKQERALADKYRRWAEALQYSHPFVSSSLLTGLVNTYEREAVYHDNEAGIRRRLS